jgi:ERCC4-related helicase
MELVVLAGHDQESWGQITGLINHGEWEKIILIKTKDAVSYVAPKAVEELEIDFTKPLVEVKDKLQQTLKSRLSGFEASLSIASGNGKEHMALISALLSIPIGVRLVAFTKKGVEFLH